MSKKLVDVYPYTRFQDEVYYLLLKRSSRVEYAEQWRMVGGKVKVGETRWQAGLRELREETGCNPVTYWTVPLINTFYEHQTDTIHHIAAFAAELPKDHQIILNYEHQNYQWIPKKEVKNYLSWPRQIELIYCIDDLISRNGIIDEWLIEAT